MKTLPLMRFTGAGIEIAAWGLNTLFTAIAIISAQPTMLAPMVLTALINASFRRTHVPHNKIVSTSDVPYNIIVTALNAQTDVLRTLPDAIAKAVASEVGNIVPTPTYNAPSVPVPGTWDKPSKVVLDAVAWLKEHPEHAEKPVRKIAELSGFSKSTIDRAKKLTIGEISPEGTK